MNQKFNLKTNNFIKNMLRYSYLIIMALLLNAVVNEIIVSANKIISVNIDYMLAGEAVDISTVIIKFIYLTLKYALARHKSGDPAGYCVLAGKRSTQAKE